jgi:hypothetical protein
LKHWALIVLLGLGVATATPAAADADADSGSEIVSKYLESTHTQQETLKGMQMEVQIQADLPKLHKTGRMNALRMISSLGKISYKMLGFTGDDTIKKDVIAQYLKAEVQGQQDTTQFAITPANYKFKYKGISDEKGQEVHIFELKPRQNRVGLFKGELWLDTKTYMPVRESGRFVKNPSVFLKKVEFTRDYTLENGVAVPKHIQSNVQTRIVGPAAISIDYLNLQKVEPGKDVNALGQPASQTPSAVQQARLEQ